MTAEMTAEVATTAHWQPRRITLIGDQAVVERTCRQWEDEGWRVVTVEPAEPTVAGHECHRVTVLVPRGEHAAALSQARFAV